MEGLRLPPPMRQRQAGFPHEEGVLLPYRVRLLHAEDLSCYRTRYAGKRKRKSVGGCIVGPDIAVLPPVIVKQEKKEIRVPKSSAAPLLTQDPPHRAPEEAKAPRLEEHCKKAIKAVHKTAA
ncbi:hypothetical protein H0H87_009622 [Tephrocybe sp. NHM501043]|nr:hypothetical protein H0H87_009622 [Tephrocybe sp. NHM501043]